MASQIRIGSLDFDDIKNSIKLYLSAQDEFKDYNFEGSGMAALVNVLAYNSHYDALAANMIANEMFLDSATKRGNVVSRAKELGYVPRSRRAAKSTLNVTFSNVTNAASIESLLIPRGTRFNTSIGDDTYTFTTRTASTISRTVENSQYVYRTLIDVYEGVLVSEKQFYNIVDTTMSISNRDVDTSTLKVEVSENHVDWTEYMLPSSLLTVTNLSAVYLIQESIDGFEIYFGDGSIGYTPADNSIVRMTYVVTSGVDGNGAVNFSLGSSISGTTGATVNITSTQSAGGESTETIESIKFNAVNQYGTQNRAVVASDYSALTLQNFSSVKDCLAWDGSDNVPPKFGKVILCAQPTTGDVLTTTQQSSISSFLEGKGVANTKVDFTSPEYVDLIVESTVRYNPNSLSIGTYELEYIVKNKINDYAKATINRFSSKLRYSTLVKTIDEANYAIVGNLTSVKLLKTITPNLFNKNNIRYSYSNAVSPFSFNSSVFYVSDSSDRMYLRDTGVGVIEIVYDQNGTTITYQNNVGSIDYNTGIVQINNLELIQLEGLKLKLMVTPVSQDLLSAKNIILNLSIENIEIAILSDYN